MDIFVNRTFSPKDQREEQPRQGRRKKKKERRRAGRDRRKSVNEGLVVSLSIRDDRRSYRDRRQHAGEIDFEVPEPEEKTKKKSFSVVA